MPAYRPSDTAKRMVALLSNAKELAVQRQLRTTSVGVVKACKKLSSEKKFGIPDETFDVLMAGIMEKQSIPLIELFHSVEEAVVSIDLKVQREIAKKNQPKNIADPVTENFLYLG
jgi:hypothetical protein